MSNIIEIYGTDFTELINIFELENNNMAFTIEIALKMIPEFNGDRDKLHRFITCCDIVGETIVNNVERNQFLNVIKCKLTGPAYNIIKYKEFLTWEALKLALQNQYLEKRTIAQIQRELLGSKQNYNESIREYANRLERLTADLNDACIASEGQDATVVIQNLNNKSCLKAFQEGLLEPIKIIIKASRFNTFNEAVESAVEEERVINQSKSFNKTQNFQDKNSKKPVRCFKCNRLGHTANKCYVNNSISQLPNYPKKNFIKQENINKIHVTCSYCKKPGHHISNCFKKRNFEYKNSNSSYPSNNSNVQGYRPNDRASTSGYSNLNQNRSINITHSKNESNPVASNGVASVASLKQ